MVTPRTRPRPSSTGAPDRPDSVPFRPLVRPASAQARTGSSRSPRPRTFSVSRPSKREATSPGLPCGKPGWKARWPLRNGVWAATGRAGGPPSVSSRATSARSASRTSAARARPPPITRAGRRQPSTTWRAVTHRPSPAMEKAVPEVGCSDSSGAKTVTAGSNGVTGPSRGPWTSSSSGRCGASAFSRRPRETISRAPITAA